MRPAERGTWAWNLIKDYLGAVKHHHPHPKVIINHELKQPASWDCRKEWAEKIGLKRHLRNCLVLKKILLGRGKKKKPRKVCHEENIDVLLPAQCIEELRACNAFS